MDHNLRSFGLLYTERNVTLTPLFDLAQVGLWLFMVALLLKWVFEKMEPQTRMNLAVSIGATPILGLLISYLQRLCWEERFYVGSFWSRPSLRIGMAVSVALELVYVALYLTRKLWVKKMLKATPVIAFVTALFTVSGGVGYFLALSGLPVRDVDVFAFENTPYALMLVAVGVFGLLVAGQSWKHLNPNRSHAWLLLAVGMGMVVMAWVYLELLLRMSYAK